MKTLHFGKQDDAGVELWRAQDDRDRGGVHFDFTVPGCADWFRETWSTQPDPTLRERDRYVERKVTALKRAGFRALTKREFERAVERRNAQDFEEPVRGPDVMRRERAFLRYVERGTGGDVRFIDTRGPIVQWWRLSFEDDFYSQIEYTRGRSKRVIVASCYLGIDGDRTVTDDLENQLSLEEIARIERRQYRWATAAQFAKAQAKRQKQLAAPARR